ncbi:AEC family transporter [Balneatrix alpica]|uniref:AEC family transporter n=1 Tax=Balneatrix alpica TaxID=75684 RepID=UPI002738D377|nr:AEC family transporter [Balneatrix alpica]
MVKDSLQLYLDTLVFTADIVTPIFILVFLGALLRRLAIVDDAFVGTASKLVFNLTLPVLVFMSINKTDIAAVLNPGTLIFTGIAILLLFVLLWFITGLTGMVAADRGAFIQGSFRSNYGIIGLAVSFNLFGTPGLAHASLLLALVIPLFNILSIVALSLGQHQQDTPGPGIFKSILTNPLIIAVLLALPLAWLDIHPHALLQKSANYIASMTLPLALLTIGASLKLKELRACSGLALHASAFKLVWMPLLCLPVAYWLGFSGEDMTMLFVLLGCPTAAASFVMARAMGANATLAASIILVTTLGSVASLSTGIYLFKLWQWI